MTAAISIADEYENSFVLITVECLVNEEKSKAFERAMRKMRKIRLRDGSYRLAFYRGLSHVGRFIEVSDALSWKQHSHQHHRLTVADREIEADARSFHLGGHSPLISHLLRRNF